jgi:ribosomal-protein-alanine N-acetyltransferase
VKSWIGDRIEITSFDRPDHRAEAVAVAIMERAFNPAFGEAWTAAQLAGFMSMPGVRLAIARMERAHLGFSLCRQVFDEAELLLIATDPMWQKRGVGSALLKDTIRSARKAGVTTVHLEVRENNPAMELYSRHGFENVHRRVSYYRGADGNSYDALSFRLVL